MSDVCEDNLIYVLFRGKIIQSYFGCFDFARKAWRPARALRISGAPWAQALSIVMRLKRHFSTVAGQLAVVAVNQEARSEASD